MNRITEIVELILKEIVRTNDFDSFDKKIFSKLTIRGYHPEEIESAFNYFNVKIISGKLLSLSKRKHNYKFRLLSEEEKEFFTPEAEKFLVQYIYSNKLEWNIIERIIDNVRFENRVVNSKELADIISGVIFSRIEKKKRKDLYIN